MSKSIRTIVSTEVNNALYDDNKIRIQFENMEMFDSVVQQLSEIQGMIDDLSIYINTTALTDLSNLQVQTSLLRSQNTMIESTLETLDSQVSSLAETTVTSDTLKIDKDNTYLGNVTMSGNIQVKTLNAPALVRIDASGRILPSSGASFITNSDIAVGANIEDTKLDTISDPGKVSISATTATVSPVPNTILLRDSSGHIFAKTQPNNVTDTNIATTAYVQNAISAVINDSPSSLDTLNELAAALGDDSNYAANVMSAISTKVNLSEPVFTGNTRLSNVLVNGMASTTSGILSTNTMGILRKELLSNTVGNLVFSDSQLETITTPGKVSNSALNVSVSDSSNTIVLRDASGFMGTGNTIINGSLIQNRHLLTDPSLCHIAGPYSQGNKWPMPTKRLVENVTKNWVIRRGANTNACTGLCWSPELKLFVGVGYSQFVIASSNSAVTWQEYNSGYANNWNAVEWSYNLNLFIAVASSGTNNRVMTSPTGISSWTTRDTTGLNYNWVSLAEAEELGLLVAVATDAGNCIMTSTDAISWTMRAYSGTYGMRTICWSKELNMFVAPEYDAGGNGNSIAISYNGITWQRLSSVLTNATYWSVCWSPERRLFVIVGGTDKIAISNNGINWTNTTIPNTQGTLQKVVWCAQFGIFVAVCSGASNRNIFWVSETGLRWRSIQAPAYPSSATLNSFTLVWSPEFSIFCMVTSNGTIDEKVFTSSLKARLVNPTTVFDSPFMSIDNSGNWTIPNINTGTLTTENLRDLTSNATLLNTLRTITCSNPFTSGNIFMENGATPGYTLTSIDTLGTSMWLPYKTIPLQINGTITANSIATWSQSGQTRTLGNITLPPGFWNVYYRTMYAAEPTYGEMTPTATPVALTTEALSNETSIVFKYTFDSGTLQNNLFANFASGTAVYDASASGGASITTSDFKVGSGALNLVKSSSQYVQLPSFTNTTNGITISFWFKHNSSDGNARIFDFGNGQDSNNIVYKPLGGAALVNGSTLVFSGGPSIIQNTTKNVWHYFAWVIPYVSTGNTTHTFYFDNNPATTFDAQYPTVTQRNSNFIGKSNYSDPYIDAQVDDFRWYNRVLSADEINLLYLMKQTYPPIDNIMPPFNYYALKLNGTYYMRLRNYTDFNFISPTTATLECWIFPTGYTSPLSGIITKSGTSGIGRYGFYLSSSGALCAYDWTTSSLLTSSLTAPLNTWSHVAMTINSGVTNGTVFYLNGSASPTYTYTFGNNLNTSLVFGDEAGVSSRNLQGYISNIRIWNIIRNSTEIANNYKKLISSSTGLIASLYLNDLPTSFRATNNVYSTPRTITRSLTGIFTIPDVSTNDVGNSRIQDVRNIVFTDTAITGRGLEEGAQIINTNDTSINYYLNGYIDTNASFNVGIGRTVGQTYLYAIQDASYAVTYYFKQYYSPINNANFNSTSGFVLLGDASASSGNIFLTPASINKLGNMWTTTNANYDTDFKITFRMDVSGSANPADGFCVQWNTANNVSGIIGGGCGVVATSKYAIRFLTYTNNRIEILKDGVIDLSYSAITNFVGNRYYWIDYNYTQKRINVYDSSLNVKPGGPTYIFGNIEFPSVTPYYIGFGAATGAAFSYHLLGSFTHELISYKIYYILPQVTPINIGVMGVQANSVVSKLDTIYSGNSYDVYRANRLSYNNMYFNMNYLNNNYLPYDNNGLRYYHHRDASNILFGAATRVYVRGYTGPVFQVRRSTDNALQDFYTDEYQTFLTTAPNGFGTTYAAWIGGATAYVTIWYNQNCSGYNNAINTTIGTTQPVISLNNGKYVIGFDSSYQTFLQLQEPIQSNTIFCEFLNRNTSGGGIACYIDSTNTIISYDQRFNSLNVNGLSSSNRDWYYCSTVGKKLSYVDGTSTTSLTAWGSWKTVSLSTTNPFHSLGGGFGLIGRGFTISESITGFMSQILFHNRVMQEGNVIGFHHERLIV